MSYIEVTNLKYRYPGAQKLALDGINFKIEKGERIGIVGESGAGKSTLCQAFVGLIPSFYKGAYGGNVLIDGYEAAKTSVSELCRKVGLVFQNPFNQLSGAKDNVYEEVAFGLQNFGVPKEEIVRRTDDVLKLLDIEEYRDRNPFDLSGGQMQRVALAGILVMRPDVIVLDEPTSQLDPEGSEEVFRAADTLAQQGITTVIVEQKMEKLARYCDKILLLHEGKQVAFDTPDRIFSRDDLESLGVQAPVCAQAGKILGIKKKNGCYPVTISELLELKRTFSGMKGIPEADRMDSKAKGIREADRIDSEDNGCACEQKEVFKVKNISFSYTEGTKILENLCLSLDNRATAIVGQNGAGKTTLVKLLKGLLKPQGGQIFYGTMDIADKTVAMLAGEIGYVFQNPDDQIFKYHVIDEVMFGPLNIGMSKETAQKKAMEMLKLVELDDKADKNPYDLELSERKLIAIASVLAMDTNVLILDEPTIAQDMHGKAIIGKVIHNLRQQGKTVISILHDMDFVAEHFERVIVMAKGKALADGTKEEVFLDTDILKEARIDQPYITKLGQILGYDRPVFRLDQLQKSAPACR